MGTDAAERRKKPFPAYNAVEANYRPFFEERNP